MDLKLSVFCEVEGKARTYDLEFQQELITIGRHSMNDVQIPDRNVSSEHARLLIEDDKVFLLDLGSSVGTQVDGREAGPHLKTPVKDGSEIRLASYRLILTKPEAALDESTMEKTSMVAMRMVKEVLGSFSGMQDPPFFEVTNDAEEGTRFELTEDDQEYRIGREADCALILKHWSISRKHALLRRSTNEITVMDLGSKNGVMVNGESLTEPRLLRDGDVVAVGHTELRFHNPAGSLLDSLDDSPTPITDLKELGVDLSPSRPSTPSPSATPGKGAAAAPAEQDSATTVTARRRSEDSSFADNIPMIVGAVLLVGAVIAAIFLFLK